jgi:hypothetical protein
VDLVSINPEFIPCIDCDCIRSFTAQSGLSRSAGRGVSVSRDGSGPIKATVDPVSKRCRPDYFTSVGLFQPRQDVALLDEGKFVDSFLAQLWCQPQNPNSAASGRT